MQLWETEQGDKWLCAECKSEIEAQVVREGWRLIFDRQDPLLRCAICGHSDIDIDD